MARKVPKHIQDKIRKSAELSERAQLLRWDVEDWLEKNGLGDLVDYQEHSAEDWAIVDPDGFITAIEEV